MDKLQAVLGLAGDTALAWAMRIPILREIVEAVRVVSTGTSEGKPLDQQLLIDFGHVVLIPVLALYVDPMVALVVLCLFGVVKQGVDAFRGPPLDALSDAGAMLAPGLWAIEAAQRGWPLFPIGVLMLAILAAYAVVRVRRTRPENLT